MDTASYEKSYSKYISTKIYQYELQTALYMLEPWEKALFNTIMLCIVGLSVLTMYQYTPIVFNKLLT
ncbi:small subunit of serine palmitoyltransferase-like protein [Chlamydoabsidia padenii]|nr:small subunit of serine palmitoyltransferase-like protein [Chlamydoabsidia padenii]